MTTDSGFSVTAEDGQTYTFGEKQKVKTDQTVDAGGFVTKFVFRNGVVRERRIDVSHPLFVRLAAHGDKQKRADCFAGLDDVEDCVEAWDALDRQLEAGTWSEKRVSDGMAGTSILVRALVEVSGKSVESIKAKLESLDAATKKALGLQPKVAEVVARIKAERAAKKAAPNAAEAEAALASFIN